MAGLGGVRKKQKKSNDQRAQVIRYYLIKESVTRYEMLFSDQRTFVCSSTINNWLICIF